MKHLIKNIALLFNVHLTAVTPAKELKHLINRLRPVKTNFELVRIGPNGDGGYLLPNDLENIEALFSPGVGKISGFENQCTKFGMKVFLADKSVDAPAISNENFIFDKKFIGATVNEDFLTVDEWVNKSNLSDKLDLMLQMDIEGYEYEALFSLSNKLMDRFRIIVLEFHELNLLFSKPFFDKFSTVFDKILQTHECVHIHPNNCCKSFKKGDIEIPPVMEFTFLRKDRIKEKTYAMSFPHDLDVDAAEGKSMILPKCWYTN